MTAQTIRRTIHSGQTEIWGIPTVMTGIREVIQIIQARLMVEMVGMDGMTAMAGKAEREPLGVMAAAVETPGRPVEKVVKEAVEEMLPETTVAATAEKEVVATMAAATEVAAETQITGAVAMPDAVEMRPETQEVAMAAMVVTLRTEKAAMVVVAEIQRVEGVVAMAGRAAMAVPQAMEADEVLAMAVMAGTERAASLSALQVPCSPSGLNIFWAWKTSP